MSAPAVSLAFRGTAAVGQGPHVHIGYVKEAGRVWVPDTGSKTVTLLDAATGGPEGCLELGAGPAHFAFDRGCARGYVALGGDDAVAVVDPLAGALLGTIALPRGAEPLGIMPAFERHRIYTLNQGDGFVTAIDTQTNEVTGAIPVGGHPAWSQPWGSSYKPITRPVGKTYVVSTDNDGVTVFDDASDSVLCCVPVGYRPVRNAIFREHGQIYVANNGDATVSIIDIGGDTVVSTVPVIPRPFRLLPVLAISGRDEMWVLSEGAGAQPGGITMIGGAGHQRVAHLEVPGTPVNWVVNGDGLLFIVTADGGLHAVDIRSATVAGRAAAPAPPAAHAISGLIYTAANLLFVLCSDETVSLFDVAPHA